MTNRDSTVSKAIRPILAFILAFVSFISSGCGPIYDSGFVPIPRQPVSGPVEIGTEWAEVIPPKPLTPYGTKQYIIAGYKDYDREDYSNDANKGEVLNLADGRKTRIEAFLYDEKGESFELQICGVGGEVLFCRKSVAKIVDGKPEYTFPSLPKDRTYTKLRVRSELPLKCESIEWSGSTPK